MIKLKSLWEIEIENNKLFPCEGDTQLVLEAFENNGVEIDILKEDEDESEEFLRNII